MRYWMDSEFIEDGKTIDLISIGIVAEDGRELYAQSVEFNPYNASSWVKENIFPYLTLCPYIDTHGDSSIYAQLNEHDLGQYVHEMERHEIKKNACSWRTREQIKAEILAFMDIEKYGRPELWGYYSAYDHVAFCQLFGTMMDLPEGYPMLTYDLRQWLDWHGMQDVRQPDDSAHNALEDARWVAETYKRLVR